MSEFDGFSTDHLLHEGDGNALFLESGIGNRLDGPVGAFAQIRKVRGGTQILAACDVHAIGPMIVTQLQLGLAGGVELANPVAVVVAEGDPQFGGGFAGTEAFAGMVTQHTVIGVNSDVAVLAHVVEVNSGVAVAEIARTPFGGGSGNSNGSDGQYDQQESDESSCSFHSKYFLS